MGCELCGRSTCIRSFHSIEEQEDHDKTKDDVMNERDALRARIEVLEKAAEYAEHHPNCGYTFDHVTQTGELVGCTCGLEAALDAAKGGKG